MKPFSQRSVYFQNYGLNPLILLKHFVYSVSNFRLLGLCRLSQPLNISDISDRFEQYSVNQADTFT